MDSSSLGTGASHIHDLSEGGEGGGAREDLTVPHWDWYTQSWVHQTKAKHQREGQYRAAIYGDNIIVGPLGQYNSVGEGEHESLKGA